MFRKRRFCLHLVDLQLCTTFKKGDGKMIKFNFKVFTSSFPGVCFVSGLALVIVSSLAKLGSGLIGLGVLLIFAGIGLYILSLYLNSKRYR